MFVQRHNTIAALDIPIQTLWAKDRLSLDLSALAGYNTVTTTSVFGGALAFHYSFNSHFQAIAGVGVSYDTSRSFQLSDLNGNNMGLVLGIVGKF